ncbi:hypothetical protein CKY39_12160 [Variovorax boronicumulans]|uniref:Phosphoribosylanthranilate isomerase n=1 Tax=Variovorax boronicumulans TaxID=436515 RepID=A0A250DHN4_9BURK|nr:hypothetical protein [Variovorax boronicumulans]ATA53887.1 hypothetical protein CKY39_12160 [Variovorax boronicumulans]
MTALPNFITFTGADEATDVAGMVELAALYPIEWGILFSPSRQGNEPRYPSYSFIQRLTWCIPSLRLSAHLCGGHSDDLLANSETLVDPLLWRFERVQVNTSLRGIDTSRLAAWAEEIADKLEPILQCRGAFPTEEDVQWIFDASGGRGIAPAAWPEPGESVDALRGYAGGLNPDNVATAVATIGAKDDNYWLDMETGVRDENDRFSLAKCRAVCEAVYGLRTKEPEHG